MSGLFTEKKWYLVSPNADGNWDQVTTAWGVNKSIFYRYIYELKEGVAHDTTLTEESWTQIDVISNPNLKTNTGYFVYVENPAIVPEPEPEPELEPELEPEQEPEPEPEPGPDIQLKVEYVTDSAYTSNNPNTQTQETMLVISAKSLDGTNKTILGIDFNLSVNAPTGAADSIAKYNRSSFDGDFDSPTYGWNYISKIFNSAAANAWTNSAGYGTLESAGTMVIFAPVGHGVEVTSEYTTLIRITHDYAATTLTKYVLVSDTVGVNYDVTLALVGLKL